MKQQNTVLMHRRGTEHQPTRRAVDTQIVAVSNNIKKNLNYMANLAKRGEFERASEIAAHVTRMKARLYELADGYVSLQQSDAPIIERKPGKSPTKINVARKSYKRFGVK